MKKILAILIVAILGMASIGLAADVKISELPEATSVATTDITVVTVDPATAPTSKKITVGNLVGSAPAGSVKSNATTGVMQITGPAAGSTRVVTIPDANNTIPAFPASTAKSIVYINDAGAWAVLTCDGANQMIGRNAANNGWECKTSINASIKANDVDAHEDISLSAAQVSRTFIHNYDQGAATATATLPAAAEGYTFIAFVSSKVAQDWVFDGNGAETIYTDIGGTLTAGRAGIKCNNQEVGSRMSCATFKTGAASWAWLCGAISGTWTAIAP
jgi:hypothetical protein